MQRSKLCNLSNYSEKTSAATEEVSASSEEQLATMEELANHSDNLSDIVKKLEKSLVDAPRGKPTWILNSSNSAY